MSDAQTPAPSTGYSLSLIIAAVGVTCTVVALVGALFLRAGRDPVDASGLPGQVAFACSFGLLFAARWVFSPSSSAAVRRGLRGSVDAVLVAEVVLALAAAVLVASSGKPAGMFLDIFVALALACQVATVLWLVRYRSE